MIGRVYDLLWANPVVVLSETVLAVHHQLIGLKGATIASLKEAHSHPVSLEQCRRFFALNPHIKPVPSYDTAGAVGEIICRGDQTIAAIAGVEALSETTLVLKQNIEDYKDNLTRFVLVSAHTRSWQCATHEAPELIMIAWESSHSPEITQMLSSLCQEFGQCVRLHCRPVPEQPFSYRYFWEGRLLPEASRTTLLAPTRHLGCFCCHDRKSSLSSV